jgi:hypothetical protein
MNKRFAIEADADADKKIIAYKHHISSHVKLLVAHSKKNSSNPTKFTPTMSQNYQELMGEGLDKFKTKNQFRKNDHWKFIDRARGVS